MREIIKDKKNVLIAVLFVLLITSLGKIFTDDYRIVACVGRNRIYEKDINKLFDANQRERILKEVINNELIDIAFDDNDLVITDKEMAANLDQMKLFNYAVTTLEDLNTKELVERYSKVKKLAPLYVVNDADLKEFIKEIIENDGDQVFTTLSIYADDEELKKMQSTSVKKDIENEADKKGYKTVRREVLSKNNYYDVDLSNMKVGDSFLYDGKSDIDEDAYSNQKALVIIEQVEDATNTLLNLQKNRMEIESRYFNKNYYEIRLLLVNRLQGEYSVKIK